MVNVVVPYYHLLENRASDDTVYRFDPENLRRIGKRDHLKFDVAQAEVSDLNLSNFLRARFELVSVLHPGLRWLRALCASATASMRLSRLRTQFNFQLALLAPEPIANFVAAEDRVEGNFVPAINGASGTAVLLPNPGLVIRKVVIREFRRIKVRLYLRKLRLNLPLLSLKCAHAIQVAIRDSCGKFMQFFFGRHP